MIQSPVSSSLSRQQVAREMGLIVFVVLAIYLPRLTALPVRGEESRWATEAREMLQTGDWVVPRQQGQVFPERPPLGSWLMGVAGMVRGEIDLWAIRAPSVIAVLLTSLVIYAYARKWLSAAGAVTAALAYASMGQVHQLGRFGESEAVFTLGLGCAILAWHALWSSGRHQTLAWCAGYGLTAIGALTKGPQAPVYFVLITSGWLAIHGEFRSLFTRSHLLGCSLFATTVGAWWSALYYATDLQTAWVIWTGLAGDRFLLSGLIKHVVSYPLETLACTMPWSLLTLALVNGRARKEISSAGPHVKYLLWALAITYPTVWLAAGARGRYFMPLYPAIAVLAGTVVDSCLRSSNELLTRFWRQSMLGLAVGILTAATALWGASMLGVPGPPGLLDNEWQVDILAGAAILLTVLLLQARVLGDERRVLTAVVCLTLVLGLTYCGVVIDTKLATSNDLRPSMAKLWTELPHPDKLVSFGPIAHRFAYEYGSPIVELPWPESPTSDSKDFEYFCFDEHPGDTPERRFNGRGRVWGVTAGTLPFAWEEVARIPCDPHQREQHDVTVVVGRVSKPAAVARIPKAIAP